MIRSIAAGLPTFLLLLDFVWLGLVVNGFYAEQLAPRLRKSGDRMAPLWTPALAFYALVVIGLAVFVAPRVEDAGGTPPRRSGGARCSGSSSTVPGA